MIKNEKENKMHANLQYFGYMYIDLDKIWCLYICFPNYGLC